MKRSNVLTWAIVALVASASGAHALFGGDKDLEEIRETQNKILERLDEQDKTLKQILDRLQGARGGRQAAADDDTVHEIPVAHSKVKGPEDAAVTIVEFSDFQCPFCARSTGLVDQILGEFPDDVNFIYKHMPLTRIHPQAMPAAKAAVAAGNQGKFWEMHDALFENYRQLSEEKIRELAGEIGLDMKQFEKDWASEETAKQVQADMALAAKVGVRGTPTFYMNGKRVRNRSFPVLKTEIEAALKKDGE